MASVIKGMILGPMMEDFLRRSMQLSRGDPLIFLQRPISAALLLIAVAAIVVAAIPAVRRRRMSNSWRSEVHNLSSATAA